jgi:prepilin-type N-terminal cleavage/methylation domain-containing protein
MLNQRVSILKNKNYSSGVAKSRKESGFTLIELTIVILIGGILISFMGTALLAFMKRNEISKTKFNMEKVQIAMTQYFHINGHYPCPAPRTSGPEDADFGRQVTDVCNSPAAFAGTVKSNGVRIGAIPTRTLNLPDKFMADAWGQKFTYAVTESLATEHSFKAEEGKIIIEDSASHSLITPVGSGHFIILSHGRTGNGSFPISGSLTRSISCTIFTNSVDEENCDDDNEFISTLVNSDTQSSGFFDDYAFFKAQTTPAFSIPFTAVMAFNLGACPSGWSELVEAKGRFVIGAITGALPGDRQKSMPKFVQQPSVPVQTATFNLTSGAEHGGDVEANMPPFVPLLYCQIDPPI